MHVLPKLKRSCFKTLKQESTYFIILDTCYFNPFYVAWCLENWQGFSLTSYERSNYMKGLERQLEKDPEDQELILKVSKCKTIA